MQNYLQSSYDLKHTTSAVNTYMNRKTHNHSLSVMDWPPERMSLNVTEAMWDHLKKEENKTQLASKSFGEIRKKDLHKRFSSYSVWQKLSLGLAKRKKDSIYFW